MHSEEARGFGNIVGSTEAPLWSDVEVPPGLRAGQSGAGCLGKLGDPPVSSELTTGKGHTGDLMSCPLPRAREAVMVLTSAAAAIWRNVMRVAPDGEVFMARYRYINGK